MNEIINKIFKFLARISDPIGYSFDEQCEKKYLEEKEE